MTIKVHPVRMKGSLYLLIPKGLVSILGIDEKTSFSLVLDGIFSYLLSYEVTALSRLLMERRPATIPERNQDGPPKLPIPILQTR